MTTANPHFNAVAEAQARRTAQAMRLSDDEILRIGREMSPEREFRLAQKMMIEAQARSAREAHQRPVVAE